MKFRRATAEDMDLITDWRWEVTDWIHEKGSDQWGDAGLTRDEFQRRIQRSIDAGETWLAIADNGEPVGTIAVDLVPDEGLWTDDELDRSYIIHRMMVPRGHAGKGIGGEMVKFAENLARSHGRENLILDVWNTNHGLHRYYESLGFEMVRTVPNHWTPSATLFEKRVSNFDPAVVGPKIKATPFKDVGR
ncbi:GNAT family N-acetyltransferase [Actinokineospora enzanensis]|uniref:GNAT family N-acetyltransferase n=1 Tax=Actinokineospora enzanensis TaxID=155975 RepID=UPI000A063453|nr:GNAT family N-acetyltransferase [Actinokineospora enzanensis]